MKGDGMNLFTATTVNIALVLYLAIAVAVTSEVKMINMMIKILKIIRDVHKCLIINRWKIIVIVKSDNKITEVIYSVLSINDWLYIKQKLIIKSSLGRLILPANSPTLRREKIPQNKKFCPRVSYLRFVSTEIAERE